MTDLTSPRNAECLLEGPNNEVGFAIAYRLKAHVDLREIAKQFPEGVVICSPNLIAGMTHVLDILTQAMEYWRRKEALARSKSMDLLMRITCRAQISEAVASSGISSTNSLALFGIAGNKTEFEKSVKIVESLGTAAEREDKLLAMNKEKSLFLRKFHNLPKLLGEDQVVVALKERSVLLIFAK